MMNRTKLLATLCIAGTFFLSNLGYATSHNSMKETYKSGSDHESYSSRQYSGDDNMKNQHNDKLSGSAYYVISENMNPAADGNGNVIAGKVAANAQNPKPVLVNAYLNDNSASSVPEPEIYAMLVAGLSLLGFMMRRKKNSP